MNTRITATNARLALTTLVCSGVFYTSFHHIVSVAMAYGNNSASVAVMYPVCIDAVILIAALTLVAKRGISKTTKAYAKAARLFGFAATIFCNITASHFASSISVAVDLIPAISLIFTVELLIHAAQGTPASRAARKAA